MNPGCCLNIWLQCYVCMCVRTRSDQGSGLLCREWVRERRRARSRPDSDALLRHCCPVHPSISPGPSQPPRRSAVSHSSHYRSATRLSCAFGRQTTVSVRCSLLIGTRASACGSTRRPGPGQLHALVLAAAFTGAQPAKASTFPVTMSPVPMQDAERRTHARAAERTHWHAGETHCAASRSRRPLDCAS